VECAHPRVLAISSCRVHLNTLKVPYHTKAAAAVVSSSRRAAERSVLGSGPVATLWEHLQRWYKSARGPDPHFDCACWWCSQQHVCKVRCSVRVKWPIFSQCPSPVEVTSSAATTNYGIHHEVLHQSKWNWFFCYFFKQCKLLRGVWYFYVFTYLFITNQFKIRKFHTNLNANIYFSWSNSHNLTTKPTSLHGIFKSL